MVAVLFWLACYGKVAVLSRLACYSRHLLTSNVCLGERLFSRTFVLTNVCSSLLFTSTASTSFINSIISYRRPLKVGKIPTLLYIRLDALEKLFYFFYKNACNFTKKMIRYNCSKETKEVKNMEKRRFKKWVLYAIFTALLAIMILLLDRFGLVQVIDSSTLDITKAFILLGAYECIRYNVKVIVNREKEKE